MPDLRSLIREQLGDLALPPTREAEVVDELAELLRDVAAERGVDLDDSRQARVFVEQQLEAGGGLAAQLAAADRGASRRRRSIGAINQRRAVMSGLRHDLGYAFRILRKSPVFAFVAIATLALGIGLNSAVFSLIDATVLEPLPVEDGDRLVRIYSQEPGGFMEYEPTSYPDYVDLSERTRSLDDVYAYAMTMLALDWGEEPEIVVGEIVTGSYFPALGVESRLGRLLGPEDDREGGAPVVVLSYAAWKSKLGGDPEAVGSELRVNGQTVTVVGVAAESFHGLTSGLAPALWIPADFGVRVGASAMQSAGSRDRDLRLQDDRQRRWLWVGGRLAEDASAEEAASELAALSTALEEQHPESNEDRRLVLLPLDDVRLLPGVDEGLELASVVLMGGVGLILLIASANLANMLLARALGRRREIATRMSLGAGRMQVARQLLVESLILALLGGGAGLGVAFLSNRLLSGIEFPTVVPISFDLALDARVVLFTLAISTLTAVIFGLAPAIEASRADLASTLREEGAARGGSRGRRRLQALLVVSQVALSVLLLTCAGLMLRSAANAHDIDPGFDPDGLVAGFLDPELQGWEEERVGPLFDRLREELASMPGAVSVSEASMLPLSLWINTWSVVPEGQEETPEREWPDIDTAVVGVDYFRTLEIPLLAGRTFVESDRGDEIRTVVVNETLARRFWPEGDALGRRLRFSPEGEPAEVVGIVADGRYRTLGEQPRPFLYVPTIQTGIGSRFLIARFDTAPELAVTGFRRAVQQVDRHLALSNFGPVEELMSPTLAIPRLGLLLFGGFGTLGLLLATLGLYGLLAYSVGQRRNEIGIRMAMGAAAGDIVSMVVRQGLLLTGVGAALGVVLALLATRVLAAALYGVSPTDPLTFVAVTVLMVAIAGVACWLPARRAARIDPNGALRFE